MNASTTLSDQLTDQLQDQHVQQMSQQLGTDPGQTRDAIAAAVPLLLGALGHQAAQPGGASSVFGALQAHGAGGGLEQALGSLLGGGEGAQGGNVLGQILGGAQPQAEAGLGQATGLGGDKAAALLKMLAPLVMAFLARHAQAKGLGADDLGQALGRERDAAQQPGNPMGDLLGAVLGQQGGQSGGQPGGLGDLIKLGSGLFSR